MSIAVGVILILLRRKFFVFIGVGLGVLTAWELLIVAKYLITFWFGIGSANGTTRCVLRHLNINIK